MTRVRELLDELDGDTLTALCAKRGLPNARSLHARRSRLARSYRGRHADFFGDLVRPQLAELLTRTWYIGPEAYRVQGIATMPRERMAEVLFALCTGSELVPELVRDPRGDLPSDDSALGDDDVSRVLLGLSVEHLRRIAASPELGLEPTGSARRLAGAIRGRVGPDLGNLVDRTLNRNEWNDLIEELGGRRRRAIEEVAEELLARFSDGEQEEDDDGEADDVEDEQPAVILRVEREHRVAAPSAGPTPPIPSPTSIASSQAGPSQLGLGPALAPSTVQHTGLQTTETVELLSSHEDLLTRFHQACQEAERIEAVVPGIDTERGRSALWNTLASHLGKLDAVIVTLESGHADEVALPTLYRHNKLRLLTAPDGSVRVNLWRFERKGHTTVLTMSGSFGGTGLLAPMLAATLWRGPSTAAFARAADRSFARARGLAHLPPPGFVERHRELVDGSRASLEVAHEKLIAALLEPTAAEGFERVLLRSEPGPAVRSAALRELETELARYAEPVTVPTLGDFVGPRTVHWTPALGLWSYVQHAAGVTEMHLGVERPHERTMLTPAVRWVVRAADTGESTLLIREDDSGRSYFVDASDPNEPKVIAVSVYPLALRQVAAEVHRRAKYRF